MLEPYLSLSENDIILKRGKALMSGKNIKTSLLGLAIALIVAAPQCAWSWGPIGHRTTAIMANERLKPPALKAVQALLGPNARLSDIALWADEQRDANGSEKWHYVNVPISESRYDPKYCQSGECIVAKLNYFIQVLKDPQADKNKKAEALKYVVHLVADLHNPFHVGDNGDKGGNLLQVRFYDIGTNLHHVWDSDIIDRRTKNINVWLWDLDHLSNPYKTAEWSRGTPEDWATESLQIAKTAYCYPETKILLKSGAELKDKYYAYALPVVQQQLAKAGIRLAYVLNEIFKK
jgi:hypothetical protein